MLRQITNGRITQTVMVSGSSADLILLAGVLAGKIEVWDKKSEGGNSTPVALPLNPIGFSVGKKYIDGSRESAFVKVPHLKAPKTIQDVKASVLGSWDAGFETTSKCEYVNEIGNSSRG